MLAERIDDRAFLGLIRKWLRAGILDTTGAILHPATGTPQGHRRQPNHLCKLVDSPFPIYPDRLLGSKGLCKFHEVVLGV
jgi:hypothetical protein